MAGFPATEAKLPMRRSSRMASRCCIDFLSSKNACTSMLSLSAAAAACTAVTTSFMMVSIHLVAFTRSQPGFEVAMGDSMCPAAAWVVTCLWYMHDGALQPLAELHCCARVPAAGHDHRVRPHRWQVGQHNVPPLLGAQHSHLVPQAGHRLLQSGTGLEGRRGGASQVPSSR